MPKSDDLIRREVEESYEEAKHLFSAFNTFQDQFAVIGILAKLKEPDFKTKGIQALEEVNGELLLAKQYAEELLLLGKRIIEVREDIADEENQAIGFVNNIEEEIETILAKIEELQTGLYENDEKESHKLLRAIHENFVKIVEQVNKVIEIADKELQSSGVGHN